MPRAAPRAGWGGSWRRSWRHSRPRGQHYRPREGGKHPIGIIILSQTVPKSIRFTLDKAYFSKAANFAALPPRLLGEIDQWIKKGEKLKILWLDDQSNSTEDFGSLLEPEYSIKLEPYENGNSAPVAKGTTWKRQYAKAKEDAQRAADAAGDGAAATTFDVAYMEGTRVLTQRWQEVPPRSVTDDSRKGDRFRMTTTLPLSQTNTFEKCVFNIGLLKDFANDLVGWFNKRLPGGVGPYVAKTTLGELVKFWGLMGAATEFRGVQWKDLWQEVARPGDIMPPPNFGRFGMTKNRATKLRELMLKPFDLDEEEMNPSDQWRYCRPVVTAFNNQRKKVVRPSWLMVMDELMSLWLGDDGVLDGKGANPFPIPFLSFVERKPDPLGAELKVAACGTSGVTVALELQEGAELHCHQQYFTEYGHTTAVCLRL